MKFIIVTTCIVVLFGDTISTGVSKATKAGKRDVGQVHRLLNTFSWKHARNFCFMSLAPSCHMVSHNFKGGWEYSPPGALEGET